MNLKQAHKLGKLKQFAKEHEIKDPHPMGKERLDTLMERMLKGSSAAGTRASKKTSTAVPSVGSSGSRTRRGT